MKKKQTFFLDDSRLIPDFVYKVREKVFPA